MCELTKNSLFLSLSLFHAPRTHTHAHTCQRFAVFNDCLLLRLGDKQTQQTEIDCIEGHVHGKSCCDHTKMQLMMAAAYLPRWPE